MYPFDRFTERAKHVLALAQEEAAQSGYIGTEHLLLGLLRETDGLGARALDNLGVRIDRVREAFQAILSQQSPRAGPSQVVPTSRVRRVIELSFEEARRMGHNYVGTEHLVLGLLIEGNGLAATVLGDLGVTLERARAEIDRLLAAGPPVVPHQQPRAGPPPAGPPLSRAVVERLERARALASEAGASEVTLEHLEAAIAEGDDKR